MKRKRDFLFISRVPAEYDTIAEVKCPHALRDGKRETVQYLETGNLEIFIVFTFLKEIDSNYRHVFPLLYFEKSKC